MDLRRPLLLTCALLALGLAAGPASAVAAKRFSATLAPATITAGAEQTLTLTLSVPSTQTQPLGSAELTAPAGYTLVSATAPATIAGSIVKLRDLAIAPGTSRSFAFVARAPCGTATATWPIRGKQANDFQGDPGNDFALSGAAPTTSVAGGCALRFAVQPKNARVAEAITNTAYTPSGAPVAVEVIDGA